MNEVTNELPSQSSPGVTNSPAVERPDFSLMLGGPLYQFYRRAHLSGDALELLHRRIIFITLFAWLPLLILSALQGHAYGGAIRIPFLIDVESNARFLVALPMLIFAELVVHERVSPLIWRFVAKRIVVDEELPAFHSAVKSTMRVRNSTVAELLLLVFVYTVGLWGWHKEMAYGSATWYAAPDATHLHLTLAGYWYVFVSIPIVQFIMLRWYFRIALWIRLLWKISKLNLHLSAANPDRCGGIGFLGKSSYAFASILFAQGAWLAGTIGNRVLYEGHNLMDFKMDAIGLVVFFVLAILGPLLIFTPKLANAQRRSSAEYGLLATRCVFGFEEKWLSSQELNVKELLETEDIRSLAEIDEIYTVVGEMSLVPFKLNDIIYLVVAVVAPMLPLLLTIFSFQELLQFLVKLIIR